jgi:hypothetical protein
VIVAILDDGAERELWLAKGWMSTGRGRSREKQLRVVSLQLLVKEEVRR